MLHQSRLQELLHYDPDTGIFKWLASRSGIRLNKIAGSKCPVHGYIIIWIDGARYRAHHLVFLYVDGYLPEGEVDHKDRIRHHNWYSNLRPDVTRQCQLRNQGNSSRNTSGVKGVSASGNKWIAKIGIKGLNGLIGTYGCFTEAVAHRLAAEQCVDWGNCDTTSPAYLYMKEYQRRKNES